MHVLTQYVDFAEVKREPRKQSDNLVQYIGKRSHKGTTAMVQAIACRLFFLRYKKMPRGTFFMTGGDGYQAMHQDRHNSNRYISIFVQLRGTRTLNLCQLGAATTMKDCMIQHTLHPGDMLVFTNVWHQGTPCDPESACLFMSIDPEDGIVPQDNDRQGYQHMIPHADFPARNNAQRVEEPLFIKHTRGHRLNELTYLLSSAFTDVSVSHFNV